MGEKQNQPFQISLFFRTWRRPRWPLPGLPESLGM
jgi:hypothetical protein